MDPDANLAELRKLMNRAADGVAPLDEHGMMRAGELFCALDEWLSAGGFLPAAWSVEPALTRPDRRQPC